MRKDPTELLEQARKLAQEQLPEGKEARIQITDYLMDHGLGIVDLKGWKVLARVHRSGSDLRTEQDAKDMAIEALTQAGIPQRWEPAQ